MRQLPTIRPGDTDTGDEHAALAEVDQLLRSEQEVALSSDPIALEGDPLLVVAIDLREARRVSSWRDM